MGCPEPPLTESISKSMRSNKRKDTKPELIIRHELCQRGYPGYRLQWKIPGRPDICYPGRKVAIFINGCFWHRCPKCHPSVPKHNRDFWIKKFEDNVQRDEENYSKLKDMGWKVVIVWECEIKHDLNGVMKDLVKVISDSKM